MTHLCFSKTTNSLLAKSNIGGFCFHNPFKYMIVTHVSPSCTTEDENGFFMVVKIFRAFNLLQSVKGLSKSIIYIWLLLLLAEPNEKMINPLITMNPPTHCVQISFSPISI